MEVPLEDKPEEVINEVNEETKVKRKRKKKHKKKVEKKPEKIGIVVVGDRGVGKSSYIEVMADDQFCFEYEPTNGVEKKTFEFETDRGVEGIFRLYDIGVLDDFDDQDSVWPKSSRVHGAILMFDVSSIASYKSIPEWHKKVTEKYPGIFMVLCGNKCDVKERLVRPKFITVHKKFDIPYYDISAKTTVNVDKPFMFFVNRMAEKV